MRRSRRACRRRRHGAGAPPLRRGPRLREVRAAVLCASAPAGRASGATTEPTTRSLYVLDGTGTVDGRRRASTAIAAGTSASSSAAGTAWCGRDGRAARAPLGARARPRAGARATHAVVDLAARGAPRRDGGPAVRDRPRPPESGCTSVTQFVGFVPPGPRARPLPPLRRGALRARGRRARCTSAARRRRSAPGSCVHLPARLVHCLENTGDAELRLLGVFRPAGSPAEAYYPDGTPAVYPTGGLT